MRYAECDACGKDTRDIDYSEGGGVWTTNTFWGEKDFCDECMARYEDLESKLKKEYQDWLMGRRDDGNKY